MVVYFINHKREVSAKLVEFNTLYKNKWGQCLKCLQFDNGTKLGKMKGSDVYAPRATSYKSLLFRTVQRNRISERMNHTIMEKL